MKPTTKALGICLLLGALLLLWQHPWKATTPQRTQAATPEETAPTTRPTEPSAKRQNQFPPPAPSTFPKTSTAHYHVLPQSQTSRPQIIPVTAPPDRPSQLQAPETSQPSAPKTFSVSGQIQFVGIRPGERPLPLSPICATEFAKAYPDREPTTRFYVTEDGGLGDVVITIEGIEADSTGVDEAPHRIRQIGCFFDPYVSVCQTGQTIEVRNHDPILHSVITSPTTPDSTPLTAALLPDTDPVKFSFDLPEPFLRLKNDVRPWMIAYVTVVDHPYYAVSAPDGSFEIANVPPGEYVVRAHHRIAGELHQDIVVAGSDLALELTFSTEHAL